MGEMLKTFFSLFRDYRETNKLFNNKTINARFINELTAINLERLVIVLIALVGIVGFQVINDSFFGGFWEETHRIYFLWTDIVFLSVLVVLIFFLLLRRKLSAQKNNWLISTSILLIVIYMALVSSIEVYEFNHFPTFEIGVIIISIIFYLRLWQLIGYFLLGLLLLNFHIFNIESTDRPYHQLSYLMPILALIISRTLFRSRLESFISRHNTEQYNTQLERDITARTQQLKESKKELEKKIEIQKQYEKILKASKQKAEESDNLKSAFIANISHEIRIPMNGIMGFSELLEKPNITKNQQLKYTRIIRNRCNDLLQIINSILDLSKVETGNIFIQPIDFELNELLREIYTTQKQKLINLGKHEISLRIVPFEDGSDTYITTDRQKLKHVLNNLIDNAIKFTDLGSIEFGYKVENPESVYFFVKDTGIGITEEHKEVIFERFRQSDDGFTRKFGGLGLGLSICKSYIEILGGMISLDSIPGEGSTFYFRIMQKCNAYKANLLTDDDMDQLRGRNILIVEDDETSRFFLQELMEDLDIKTDWAVNGNQGLNKIIENYIKYDMVLMDINLPDISGLELTKKIREKKIGLPIIAQTAYHQEENKSIFLSGGCNEYIRKPIDAKELFQKMNKCLVNKVH